MDLKKGDVIYYPFDKSYGIVVEPKNHLHRKHDHIFWFDWQRTCYENVENLKVEKVN